MNGVSKKIAVHRTKAAVSLKQGKIEQNLLLTDYIKVIIDVSICAKMYDLECPLSEKGFFVRVFIELVPRYWRHGTPRDRDTAQCISAAVVHYYRRTFLDVARRAFPVG